MAPKQGDYIRQPEWAEAFLVTRVGVVDGKPSIWLHDGIDAEWRYPATAPWIVTNPPAATQQAA